MSYANLKNKKGQAVLEMALFGSLMIFIFGLLLSFMQRFNDQQYVQMKAFRRSLEHASEYVGSDHEGQGASVQYTLIENRRHADLSDTYLKRSPQSLSATSSVYWAIPEVDEDAKAASLMAFGVNEDEKVYKVSHYIPEDNEQYDDEGDERDVYWSLQTGEIGVKQDSDYTGEFNKQENPSAISITKSAELEDKITTTIPIQIAEKHKNDQVYEKILKEKPWVVEQYLYRDPKTGEYKYSSKAEPNAPIKAKETWVTEF